MTIQKPDFNQIFASQAPNVDKPPVFNNYNGGWGDESRPNNGKPTIKGFNYLQQLNDNKFLWMVQNGAFPYDPNTEYAVGVVTIKDGRFKKWDGTNWINFGQDDNALKSENNLSDLENNEASRNNLGVYSKIEVDDAISSAIPPETPNATETVAGKAKIATTAIVQEGINDADFITPKKLKENTIAFGVDWLDVSASRAVNTNYVNTLPRAIIVRICFFISAPATFTSLQVDGKVRDQAGAQTWATNSYVALSAEVPSGKAFRFDVPTGSVSQINWGEL